MMKRLRVRWLPTVLAAVLLGSVLVLVGGTPASAAPCWTTFYPGPPRNGGPVTITYVNCSDTVDAVQPNFTNGASVWVYENKCTVVSPGQGASWYLPSTDPHMTYGVNHCFGHLDYQFANTEPTGSDWPDCYTSFGPPNPGPDAHMVQLYRNC